jgi:outer membrane protein OmpA-like peptidoglycan-associated protein
MPDYLTNQKLSGIFRRSILAAFFLFFLAGSLSAQNFNIAGKVRCYNSKENILAKVTLEKQPDANLTFVSRSGTDGYSVTIAKPGIYLLKASLNGYLPQFHEINLDHDSLKDKGNLSYDFFLVPFSLDQILPFRNILFEPSSSAIAPMALPELSMLHEILNENPSLIIRLEGHTDNQGKSRSSTSLAKRRIKSVRKFLTSKGINSDRIMLKAFGGGNPLFKDGTHESHQANRRVEIRIIGM